MEAEATNPVVASEDVTDYAEGVRRTLRLLPDVPAERWRELFESGLREALRQRDLKGLAAVVHLATNLLDAQGRFGDAVAEIDHALAVAGSDADAAALLWSIRASCLVTQGATAEALASVDRANEALQGARSPFARRKALMYGLVARCCSIAELGFAEVESAIRLLQEEGEDSEVLFLLSWYVPYLYARGHHRRAHPWVRQMRIQAELADHRWRQSDATVFEIAEVTCGIAVEPEARTILRPHWLAGWRRTLLALRQALWRCDWSAAERALPELALLKTRAGAAQLGEPETFGSLLRAHASPTSPVDLPTPDGVHLWNLPSVLAAAEAVALAGSQSHAAVWLDWFSRTVPTTIKSALEWPASVDRIRAMLFLRAGDPRASRHHFELAIRWGGSSGYSVEAALAKTQLAEVLAHSAIPVREAIWMSLRREGWAELRGLAIDPFPHAYAASHSVALARGDVPRPNLSPRECQVLVLLAEGLGYRELADRLGIKEGTVHTLAHRAFEKLNVRGRFRAVEEARALGIL